MLKSTKFFFLYVCLLLGASSLFSQEKLTLQQFIETALKSNENIQVAMESINGAEEKINETKSAYYPQATLSASYTRMSLVQEITMPYNGQMMTIRFGSPNNYSLKLGVSQQVYNFGRTGLMVKMNQIGTDLAKENVNQVKHVLSYQLVPLFYGILFTRDAIKVLDDTSLLFKQKLSIAEERYKAGLASDFDVSLLKVQISTIEGQKIDLLNNIRKWDLTFNRIAGRNLDTTVEPDGSLDFQPFSEEKAGLVKEAGSSREELKILEHQDSLAQTQSKLAQTGNKPTLMAALNYEFRNGYMPSVNRIKGNWNAVLSASYPVFDGFKTKSQVAQASVSLRTIEKQKTDLLQSIELEISQGLEDIKTIEQKIEIEKIKIKHAENALKIAEDRFRKGMISTTDLIDSQNAVENAKLNHLQLIYSHVLTRYNVFRAVGRKLY